MFVVSRIALWQIQIVGLTRAPSSSSEGDRLAGISSRTSRTLAAPLDNNANMMESFVEARIKFEIETFAVLDNSADGARAKRMSRRMCGTFAGYCGQHGHEPKDVDLWVSTG